MTERVALPVQRIKRRSTPASMAVARRSEIMGRWTSRPSPFPVPTALPSTSIGGRATARPEAVVQIEHGMGEHAARYRRLAEALTGAGYAVVADDHRGHGVTAGGPEGHGDLGADGWEGLVGDIGRLSARRPAREFPDVPLVVLGHSMGSFALQQYLLDHSGDLDAAVLTGHVGDRRDRGRYRPGRRGRSQRLQRTVRAADRLRVAQPRRGRGRSRMSPTRPAGSG